MNTNTTTTPIAIDKTRTSDYNYIITLCMYVCMYVCQGCCNYICKCNHYNSITL